MVKNEVFSMDSSAAPSSITLSNEGLSLSYGVCKYRTPCGYCALKMEQCNLVKNISETWDDDKWKITPTWDQNQNLNEVTCK